MGRLKFSLITEPKFAHDAAAVFREMKQFEEVDLINSKAIADSEPRAMENSLYEAVETKEAYVDVCLKRYLGHIIKVSFRGRVRAGEGRRDTGLLFVQ